METTHQCSAEEHCDIILANGLPFCLCGIARYEALYGPFPARLLPWKLA